jgi:AraC-like DNA-binding protein
MPKRVWEPSKSTVEKAPNSLQVSHDQPGVMGRPHWHAQVEVNFVMRGAVHYQMHGHSVRLESGSLALFWGGLPHQVVDTSVDAEFVAIHLPLVLFFRLRLPYSIRQRLMHGATLVASAADKGDFCNFDRWSEYMLSGNEAKIDNSVDELLLRIERIPFERFSLFDPSGDGAGAAEPVDAFSFHRVRDICAFITDNFRQHIDSSDIAISADIHPKYAMSIFRKSTGMTLNEYVSLLRLSYAQAMLINDDANVLRVAMESGFGSLSAFNKSFRKIAGKSPSDYRRDYWPRHNFHSSRKSHSAAAADVEFGGPGAR